MEIPPSFFYIVTSNWINESTNNKLFKNTIHINGILKIGAQVTETIVKQAVSKNQL